MAWVIARDESYTGQWRLEDGSAAAGLHGLIGGPEIADLSVVPTAVRAIDRASTPPDLIIADTTGFPGSAAIVSQSLRDAIESVEPGVHQFFAVTLKDRQGAALPDPGCRYVLRVRRVRCCVLFAQSDHLAIGVVRAGETKGKPIYNCRETGLVISRPAMGGAHLMSTSIVAPGNTLVSDALMAECVLRKVTGLRRYPARELDLEWNMETAVPALAQWLGEKPAFRDEYERMVAGMN